MAIRLACSVKVHCMVNVKNDTAFTSIYLLQSLYVMMYVCCKTSSHDLQSTCFPYRCTFYYCRV